MSAPSIGIWVTLIYTFLLVGFAEHPDRRDPAFLRRVLWPTTALAAAVLLLCGAWTCLTS